MCRKKPSKLPDIANAMMASSQFPVINAMMPIVMLKMSPIVVARPSMPSIRFSELTAARIHRIASGVPK